jgi:hypothetical protein
MDKTEAMKKAEELLPCFVPSWCTQVPDKSHASDCPALHRDRVAAALLSVDNQAEKRGYARGFGAHRQLVQDINRRLDADEPTTRGDGKGEKR